MPREPNLVVRCPHCEDYVTGVKHGEHEVVSEEGDIAALNLFVSCPECHQAFLLETIGPLAGSTGVIYWDWEKPVVLYPGGANMDLAVPDALRTSYIEAHKAFHDAGAFNLAALGCRRTIELMCKEQGAKKHNLEKKLIKLRDKGVIDLKIHQWADEVLRNLGNEAAHDEPPVSREDAQSALEFTKAILEYVYVFEEAYQRFKKRRDKKS